MEPSIACAKAGVTTGEWGQALRHVFGEYRAPTGVGAATTTTADDLTDIREAADQARSNSAAASNSWSASRASTATPTAPSRSPCAPATAAWMCSTKAFA